MRLVQTRDFSQTDFNADQVPRYAILSHRWQEDELTFQDLQAGAFFRKKGFQKIKEACRVAERSGCHWMWIDTCCIDKRDAVELNEAINSMYKWYQQAEICIAYIFDHTDKLNHLSHSSWFRRCWTLQELIAPRDVKFYDSRWTYVGSKRSECKMVAAITGIPEWILRGGDPKHCSVAQRLSWAANRRATRVEDEAYSLLGLFDMSMPTLYGTGSKAFQSLQKELLQKSDQSILAWNLSTKNGSCKYAGLLAASPADFASCRSTRSTESPIGSIMLVGDGVELEVDTIPYTMGVYLCALDCTSDSQSRRDAILLQQLDAPSQYGRILSTSDSIISVSKKRLEHGPSWKRRRLYVHHELRHPPMRLVRGIRVRHIDLLRQYRSSYGKIRILSRLDGSVSMSDECSMVQLPADEWGTTGIIYFPRDQPNFRHWAVRWIKLGFDDEFCPVIRLGSAQLITDDVSMATKSPPKYGTTAYEDIWDNYWIWEVPVRMTKTETVYRSGNTPNEVKTREYTPGEYFNYRGFEQHEAGPTVGIRICMYYLGLRVELGLEDLHPQEPARHPSAPGPGPWKVWTLDIEEVRDFAKENQKRKLLEATAAASTGILLGTLGAAYIYTKHKQRQQNDGDLAQDDADARAARPNRTSTSSAAP